MIWEPEIEPQFSEQGGSPESEHSGGKWSDTNCGLFVLLLTQNLFYVPANSYLLWTWFWNGNFRFGPRVEQKQTWLMCLYPAPRTLWTSSSGHKGENNNLRMFTMNWWLPRLAVVLYSVGVIADFGIRLGLIWDEVGDWLHWSRDHHRRLTTFWMVFYKLTIYVYQVPPRDTSEETRDPGHVLQSSGLATAVIRLCCIRFPVQFHNKWVGSYRGENDISR